MSVLKYVKALAAHVNVQVCIICRNQLLLSLLKLIVKWRGQQLPRPRVRLPRRFLVRMLHLLKYEPQVAAATKPIRTHVGCMLPISKHWG